MNETWVAAFDEPRAADAQQSGGKGANLAKLTQLNFPVPPGLIVTASAYRAFLAQSSDFVRARDALDLTRPDTLREQCAALRGLLTQLPLPEALAHDLAQQLPSLLANGPVSVRSSSTLEDLSGAAFAGQHDTYLNVAKLDDVLDAVRRCFASLWEDRAARYRHEHGYGQDQVAMAVVVQLMVPSDVAGVGFCINPVTGNLGECVINASYGLGETVVSGEGEIDQFVVEKKSGDVTQRTIGIKTHTIRGTASGTERVAVEPSRQQQACLSDAEVRELWQLMGRVEQAYGFPQDIEWAFADGRCWLLQARPITKFPPRWTRDESAERFPNVTTPLAWDFVSEGFHQSLSYSLQLMGLPPFHEHWFERFDAYIYGNQTAVALFTRGQHVQFDDLDDLRRKVPEFRARYQWTLQLPVTWMRDLDGYLFSLGRLDAVDLRGLNDGQLWSHVEAIDAIGRNYFLPNIAISITQGILHRLLFRLIGLVAPADQARTLYDHVTGYCETKTNLVNRDLYRLYALAKRDPRLSSLLLERPDRRALWESGALSAYAEFFPAFAKFLRDHGHREVDWDVFHPTWAGQPWVLLESLRLMLSQQDVADPAARERELRIRQSEAERAFVALVPEDLRFFASELLRLARAYTALDDLEHYQTTRLNPPFRRALIALGGRLAGKDALPDAESIFFLRKQTLQDAVLGRAKPDAVRAEAAANRADYLRQQRQTPAWVRGEVETATVAGNALKGLPGSPGVAEGVVCRIFGPEDFPRFVPGSVLVARTTNPAWTALFYNACAVVTESGGPLSHGAVTAREAGLPAVMCVRGVLDALPDGTRVRVNGTAGTVERLA